MFTVDGKELKVGEIIFEKENVNFKYLVEEVGEDLLIFSFIPISEEGKERERRGETYKPRYKQYDFSLQQDWFYRK
jgi:hypothetical protein